ncbi:MAG: hypothetical protein OJF47_000290 [Nitrospira sp.]|jgi:hypothetical protein|nr:MAG: hypothetical protein OJF47_000290 [Nitrospira sp.]
MNIDAIIDRNVDGRMDVSMATSEGPDHGKAGSGLQRKLEQLRETEPLWTTMSGPSLAHRLQECLKAGDAVEAERIVTQALALINGSRNCMYCDT